MSLKMYFDAGLTQAVLTAEKFPGNGAQATLTLVAFTGGQLGGVYKETKASHSNISFVDGVGSGFVGLIAGTLKGQRVIFGNQYVGQVVDNTDTTITVSNTATSGPAQMTYLTAYKKLYSPTDFTLAGNVITVVTPAASNETIHAVPTDTLAMYFGGAVSETVTKQSSIYLKRATGFEYTALQVASDDTSLFPYHTTTSGIVFTGGTGVGFTALPVNGLVGKALNHNGLYRGLIVSNTATEVVVDNGYSGAAAGAEIYNVGTLLFSTNGTTWAPVIHPADLTGAADVLQVYFKDTVKIPAAAVNYPSTIIKVSGVEFVAA